MLGGQARVVVMSTGVGNMIALKGEGEYLVKAIVHPKKTCFVQVFFYQLTNIVMYLTHHGRYLAFRHNS